ncbi:hypothetical protein ABPG72_016995 [Tetrahymena utriculariae]
MSQYQIAKDLNVDKSKVKRTLDKFKQYGSVEYDGRQQNKGQRKFDEEQIDQIKEIVRDSDDTRIRSLTTQVKQVMEVELSHSTLYRNLKVEGSYLKPEFYLTLNESHKQQRMSYSNFHLKHKTKFQNVVFTDESTFYLNRNTKKVFTLNNETKPSKQKQNPNFSLMVWGSISFKGKIHLEFVEDRLNSLKYIGILQKMIPKANAQFGKKMWKMQQDNAAVHKAKIVTNYLDDENINTLVHPPNSPDLNPIEFIWGLMKREVENSTPKNKEELRNSILKSWNNIQISTIKNCINHLHSYIQKVQDSNGDYPKENHQN